MLPSLSRSFRGINALLLAGDPKLQRLLADRSKGKGVKRLIDFIEFLLKN